MKRELRTTSDGSRTLYVEHWDEHYHSVHGAVQESMHVFILHGFRSVEVNPVSILEFGFGTGLNALLTLLEAETEGRSVRYTAMEAYPLTEEEWRSVEYGNEPDAREPFELLHTAEWETTAELSPAFSLFKTRIDFLNASFSPGSFDLIYFDAFAPSAQPELWETEVFEKCYEWLKDGGELVTYCAKGQVKRNMRAAGFEILRLPGPPGKREMTKAVKSVIEGEMLQRS